jgi:thiaminase/transcriptional activator TenA
MSAPDFGSVVFAHWREAADDQWQAYTRHSFVEQLAKGSLPPTAFIRYLIQDYVFLIHFARAWGMAVVKAGNVEEMKLAASVVDGLINHELQLHVEECGKEGIAESELYRAEEEIENLAYTRYVLDAGLAGDFLDLLAALAPCVLGYGEIGPRLKQSAVSNNPFQGWIDTYAGNDYQAICRSVGKLLDAAVDARLGPNPSDNPRWQTLTERFRTATRLEVGFWDMGLRGIT